MKKGFTLVELSIVLVIIGLLIGGILIGQSLISASKVSAFVSQIQQFDSAVNSFKTKYKQLPGDAKVLSSLADNDGLIEDGLINCCGYTFTTVQSGENDNFWAHLQISGFKIKGINSQLPISSTWASGNAVIVSGANQNAPKMPLGVNTGVVAYTITNASVAGSAPFGSGTVISAQETQKGNYYFIADFTATFDATLSNAGNAMRRWADSIPVEQAQAIDSKIDDGKPNSGSIFNASYYTSPCWPSSGTTSSGRYNVTGTGSCALLIRMPDK